MKTITTTQALDRVIEIVRERPPVGLRPGWDTAAPLGGLYLETSVAFSIGCTLHVGFDVDWDNRKQAEPLIPTFTINAPALSADPLSALLLSDTMREMVGLAARLRAALDGVSIVSAAREPAATP